MNLGRAQHLLGGGDEAVVSTPFPDRRGFVAKRAADRLLDPAPHGLLEGSRVCLVQDIDLDARSTLPVDATRHDAAGAVVDTLLHVSPKILRDLDLDSKCLHSHDLRRLLADHRRNMVKIVTVDS